MLRKDLTPRYAALAGAIEAKLGAVVERLPTTTGELGYRVAPDDLLQVCRTLRDEPELKLEMLIDVCGVDYQSYGKDEWQTSSATGTGFSRGTLRDGAARGGHRARDLSFRRRGLPSSITCCRSPTITGCG